MENLPISNPPLTPTENPINAGEPATTYSAKTNSFLPIVLAVSVSAVLFGLGGYYFGKMNYKCNVNYSRDIQADIAQTPTATPEPSASPTVSQTPKLVWVSYTNPTYLYEVQYPDGWRMVPFSAGEGFGPKEVGEDVLWGINSYDKSAYSLDQIASGFGKQFSDRSQTKQNIFIDSIPATKFVTTTATIPDWYSEAIVIESGTHFIVISNGAISSEDLQKRSEILPGVTFEKFYSSFRFVQS